MDPLARTVLSHMFLSLLCLGNCFYRKTFPPEDKPYFSCTLKGKNSFLRSKSCFYLFFFFTEEEPREYIMNRENS